jgi:agmatine deiminase
VIPQFIAKELNIPIWSHDLILEGGSIEVNGAGTVMTTEQCLLNQNRNANLSRGQIESALHDALGTRHILWLPGGIEGDDTDGHIDDVARFIGPDTVAAEYAPPGHPDHAVLDRNWRALEQARDQDGRPLRVLALPAPPPMAYDYPPRGDDPGGREPLPASYANFLMLNDGVLVPVFHQPTDEAALAALAKALPGRQVIGVPAERLVVGCGSLHCLSMQQPRV